MRHGVAAFRQISRMFASVLSRVIENLGSKHAEWENALLKLGDLTGVLVKLFLIVGLQVLLVLQSGNEVVTHIVRNYSLGIVDANLNGRKKLLAKFCLVSTIIKVLTEENFE
ncbi:hypothetical protein BJX68DRAFT_263797 [Aspergillus pseudodeflectus]|uniref:Uncharacterized protein n=1 Tax=Aspergillus pseudodeflectus TaxID=176178 RepID=A0ABR4KVM0_9EURO